MNKFPFINNNNNPYNNFIRSISFDKFNESLHKTQKKYTLSR